jgi:L,D-transpeptidase YbiS
MMLVCSVHDDQNQNRTETYEGGTLLAGGESRNPAAQANGRPYSKKSFRPYIVIDRYCNRLFLRTADSIWLEALCSTGTESNLEDTLSNRQWKFATPAGVFVVDSKLKNPWWKKPDWAYIEEGLPLPKKDGDRLDDQMMGDYAIGFGDGYFIHGTIYERLLGLAVTHGCVRLGAEDLKMLYDNTPIGTKIYIY